MRRSFDLVEYLSRFDEVVERRYGRTFADGFRDIDERYKEVREGDRPLTVDDVMAIFDEALPYVRDWTKPDKDELARKMTSGGQRPVAMVISELKDGGYDLRLVKDLVDRFRELTLAALVLHHVYPERFAMCSHHLASLLNVTSATVPEYYVEFCRELTKWGEHPWPTPGTLTVAQAEFGLWTWYRLAFIEGAGPRERLEHKNRFYGDSWVQRQRASRIGKALGAIDALDLAVAFNETKPSVAVFTVLRELELAVRALTDGRVLPKPGERHTTFSAHINALQPHEIPSCVSMARLHELKDRRNEVAHQNVTLKPEEARVVVDEVALIVRYLQALV